MDPERFELEAFYAASEPRAEILSATKDRKSVTGQVSALPVHHGPSLGYEGYELSPE